MSTWWLTDQYNAGRWTSPGAPNVYGFQHKKMWKTIANSRFPWISWIRAIVEYYKNQYSKRIMSKTATNQNSHSWDQNSHSESPKQPHTKTTKTKTARSKVTWKYLVSEWMLSLPTLTLLLVYVYYRPISSNEMQFVRFAADYWARAQTWLSGFAQVSMRTLITNISRRNGRPKTVYPMLSDHCLWRWCILAKRLDGPRCHLVQR